MTLITPSLRLNPGVIPGGSLAAVHLQHSVQKDQILVLLVTSSVLAANRPGSEASAVLHRRWVGDSCVYSFLTLTKE